jgi:hypothetical protein
MGSRLTGKLLGRRLTERVNGDNAMTGIRARETALRGQDGRTSMGFAAGCSEWGRRREKGAEARRRHPAPFWEGAGEAGGGRGTGPTHRGSGTRAKGGPCRPAGGARPAAAQGRWARVTCAVRALLAEQRGRGEADE